MISLLLVTSNLNATLITYSGFGAIHPYESSDTIGHAMITLQISDQLQQNVDLWDDHYFVPSWSIVSTNDAFGSFSGTEGRLFYLPNMPEDGSGWWDLLYLSSETGFSAYTMALGLLDINLNYWPLDGTLAPVIRFGTPLLCHLPGDSWPGSYEIYDVFLHAQNVPSTPVPEPTTLLLLGTGLLGLAGLRKKMKR